MRRPGSIPTGSNILSLDSSIFIQQRQKCQYWHFRIVCEKLECLQHVRVQGEWPRNVDVNITNQDRDMASTIITGKFYSGTLGRIGKATANKARTIHRDKRVFNTVKK